MIFYRGIAVHPNQSDEVREHILRHGLADGDGWWNMRLRRPTDRHRLLLKPDLSTVDTQDGDVCDFAAVCACGEPEGAAFYAADKNRTPEKSMAMVIQFEADLGSVAVDGRDFLYTAFQFGNADRARPILSECFGSAVLEYANRAWRSEDTSFRIAQCDLAITDPAVVKGHYGNRRVIGGRGGTVFRNAFLVELPVAAASIISVSADVEVATTVVDYGLHDILADRAFTT